MTLDNDTPMLAIDNLSKTFYAATANEVKALQQINLSVDPGSFVVVIGTNGSGKSTLLNAVAGTFPVDSGSIVLDGQEVAGWPEHRRAALIGRVFQNPFSGTAPSLSIGENIALATRRGLTRGLSRALPGTLRQTIFERVRLLGLGLEERLDNPIGTLSGGQRQSLTLLMATWNKPRLLLLDEHTAALDPKSADQIIALSDQLIRRERLTTLMVTHSMHQAANLGDRLIMMDQGRIVFDFSGAEKRRLRVNDLLDRFEEVRRIHQLDQSAADMLRRTYI